VTTRLAFASAIAVLLAASTAHAAPSQISAELLGGEEDVTGVNLATLQPRLVLRLDRDAPLAVYIRGGLLLGVDIGSGDGGGGVDGALGGDARLCRAGTTLCAGFRLGLGAQYFGYGDGEGAKGQEGHTSVLFLEAHPYLSWGPVSLAFDTRVARSLSAEVGSRSGSDRRTIDDDSLHVSSGVSLAFAF
jgi:hypothetical protein